MLVTIKQILLKKNKSVYWLSKQIDCDFQGLQRLCDNKTTSISFNTIQKICKTLDCTPSEIFMIED